MSGTQDSLDAEEIVQLVADFPLESLHEHVGQGSWMEPQLIFSSTLYYLRLISMYCTYPKACNWLALKKIAQYAHHFGRCIHMRW
jgi:hypothetical protein